MVNVATEINRVSSSAAIDLHYESIREERSYLGLSQAGHKCPRFLWYVHNNFKQLPINGRVLRLFEMGNIIEQLMFDDFARAGFTIRDAQKEVSFHDDDIKLVGHTDGVISGLLESNQDHLWECKSMNDKGFKKLLKHGYEANSEIYKFQVHAYALALGLKKIFVSVYNKNDSTLYQERIDLNTEWIVQKLQDVFWAIKQKTEPPRKCPRVDWWEVRFCNYRKECMG